MKEDPMMRNSTPAALGLVASLMASTALAQGTGNANPYNDTGTMSSVTEKGNLSSGLLKDEIVSLKPEFGVATYTAPNNQGQGRATYGILSDLNFSKTLPPEWGPIYLGITSGLMFTHLGSATSNFWGSDPSQVVTDPGANMLLFPADIEAGWAMNNNARLAIHGGANVLYRSVANSIDMGDSSSVPGSVWRLFPNLGVDFDYSIGRNVAISIRPDLTLTPGNNVFIAAVGVGIGWG